ncbi:ferrochelatase [Verrucomicrobiaceae bacterium N1E253]|uniref:Ferrochelatase n=1 Tax=Oceaniferula marina TaxID=2748318 RepID=A0A851GII4_9BACT|nr:ferrochelatase [Oceaniferula marina]NWK57608.1 ferrochelatase [Oceaniferula marina]
MTKAAALLLNLGSPDSTSVPDVRRYLDEFLSDERVLDIPAWKRKLILKLFILPKRPAESAEAYSEVWTEEGSPLIVTSKEQQKLVSEQVDIPVFLGMRYGNPSTEDIIRQIVNEGVTDLFIMPLYPHYAMSSYETAVVKAMEEINSQAPHMRTKLLQPFYQDPDYIEALVESAKPHFEDDDDLLLFSYHGIPERQVRKSDPSHAHCLVREDCCENAHPCHATCYKHQCLATTKAFIEASGVPQEKTAISFQSRLLRDPWLGPYTDFELKRFGQEGVKKIKVMCPAFVSDCLETIEEIGMRGVEEFTEAGGESLSLIPCMNDHPSWIKFLSTRIQQWQQTLASTS